MEIAVVGDQDFVVGFRLAGIRNVHETTKETIQTTVESILKAQNVGIMIINMKDIECMPATLQKRLTESTTPVVIPVGGEEGDMREKVRRAIGVDLYKGE